MDYKDYKIDKHNSTVLGYPGRDFDWTQFCWNGDETYISVFKGDEDMKAPSPWVDDGLIEPNCQYLHIPYRWVENGTIYRVRPNESMRAGKTYRGKLIKKQEAIRKEGIWYWRLIYGL